MIRINLLPEEYRRNERTSPKVFVAVLVSIILICSASGWFFMVYFGDLEEHRRQNLSVTETLIGVSKQATYFDGLVKERKEFSKRSDTIRTIASSRMVWTKVIDEIIDVVNNNTERHVSWFQSISIRDGTNKIGPTMSMPGSIEGEKISRVADFYDDLQGASFSPDIRDMTLPGAKKATNKKRYPPTSYTFNLKWTFKAASQWARNRVGAKPAKPAK